MGFVSSTPKITLNAYLTQVGREYFISGTVEQTEIMYFSVGDSDCNYLISQIEIGDEHNTLVSGYVPDLTGDTTGCIKSVADGIGQKYYIEGGSGNAFKSFNTIIKEINVL
jgi:hypothetical protein